MLAAALACLVAVPVTLAAVGTGGSGQAPVNHGPRGARSRHNGPVAQQRPRPRRERARAALPDVIVTLGSPVRRVPRSYLGLSMEYWGVPVFEHHLTSFARILRMLRVPGDDPLLLRIGGDSADRTLWDPNARRLPRWVFGVRPVWLSDTARLLAAEPLRLILDLNLVTASPLRAATFARAALTRLPSGSVTGFEIGNEPDLYDRPFWLGTITPSGAGGTVLPAAISASSYLAAFSDYSRTLAGFTPGIPLLGPAVAAPMHSISWLSLLATRQRSRLAALTAHSYPYSACATRRSRVYPTVARLLSPRASTVSAAAVSKAVTVAHRAGLPLRMTELNSVTCGGRPGVSNAFATALWAPDALFELMRTGVDAVDIHVRADTVNAAMVPVAGGLQARPLLFGMALFTRTLAAGGELLRRWVRGAGATQVKAWAVRTPVGGRRVLLINKGSRGRTVRVSGAGSGAAVVSRLIAPSAAALSGTTLGGRWIGRDGRWHGRGSVSQILRGPRGYVLTLPATSAALVTIGG